MLVVRITRGNHDQYLEGAEDVLIVDPPMVLVWVTLNTVFDCNSVGAMEAIELEPSLPTMDDF